MSLSAVFQKARELREGRSRLVLQASEGFAWMDWCRQFFPQYVEFPFADRHIEDWEWFESLEHGKVNRPRIRVCARFGGKSMTLELAIARMGCRSNPPKKFVAYVCDTQDQADEHVATIGALMAAAGVEPAVNKFGNRLGWKRNVLRCSNGFNVVALGLDSAVRGIKFDEHRIELFALDDLDNASDTPQTTRKKEAALTKNILPAGSDDACVFGTQNLILETGMFAKLVDGKAEFLLDADVPPVQPAVVGLETESYTDEEGRTRHRITAGVATWAGQGIERCQQLIDRIGLPAFLIECQHEVKGAQTSKLFFPSFFEGRILPHTACPRLDRWYRGLDTATEIKETADDSATVKLAFDPGGCLHIRMPLTAKFSPTDLSPWIEGLISPEPTVEVIVEAHNMGYGVFAYFQRQDVFKRLVKLQKIYKTQGNKRQRAMHLSDLARQKKVYVYMEGDYLKLLDQFYGFTGVDPAETDDLIDAITVVLTWLKEGKSGYSDIPDVNPLSRLHSPTYRKYMKRMEKEDKVQSVS